MNESLSLLGFFSPTTPSILFHRKQALTFVIVGAGPTGVEFTAELRDFIEDDVPQFYPHLLPVGSFLRPPRCGPTS